MGVQSGGDHGDRSLVLGIFIIHGAENDIGIVTGQLLNVAGSLIGLDQADIAGNIDDHMGSAFNGSLKERAGYGLLHCL